MEKRTWGGAVPDTFSRWSQEAKLSHPHVLRTGEEALSSTRVLHQRLVVSRKLSFLKHDYLTFCFNPDAHVRDTVIKIKASLAQANAGFGGGLRGLWTAISVKGKRAWRKGVGGRARNYTYSNNVFISQQLYNKKLSGAESDLTTNSSRKHASL